MPCRFAATCCCSLLRSSKTCARSAPDPFHGVYGCQWNWWLNGAIDRTMLEMLRDGTAVPMMIAMPSDGLWGDGSGYVPHEHANYERWIVDDIPDCLHELFPKLQTDKFLLAGLSMGGFGAMRLGMKYAPRVLGISAHSSVTDVTQLSRFIPYPAGKFLSAGTGDTQPAALGRREPRSLAAAALRLRYGRFADRSESPVAPGTHRTRRSSHL